MKEIRKERLSGMGCLTSALYSGILGWKEEAPNRSFVLSKFWRNTQTEKHRTDDPLRTDPLPTPTPSHDVVCGACGCKIARSGEILTTGETYKRFLSHEQTIEAKDREISGLNAEITRLREELRVERERAAAAAPAPAAASREVGRKVA